MASAAEIAYVGRVSATSADLLAAHVPNRHGLCATCRVRVHPCSRRIDAEHAAQWAERRIREMNASLDGRSWHAVLSPTVCLPMLRAASAAPDAAR